MGLFADCEEFERQEREPDLCTFANSTHEPDPTVENLAHAVER